MALSPISDLNLSENTTPAAHSRDSYRDIYLAGGCFWGTEYFLKQIRGVLSTESGYANGSTKNPSYEQVCSLKTGYAETVHVTYDSKILALSLLLDLFFQSIDPTSLNRQGNDSGEQYRTGIYYTDTEDIPVILDSIKKIQLNYKEPIITEVQMLRNFYPAEEYHQNYLEKNPVGYCHIKPAVISRAREANRPENKFRKLDEDTLKKRLSPMQYNVTQMADTEPPFNNEFWNEQRRGIYVDITTGEPLFVSSDKFNTGCGWPGFTRPISEDLITRRIDTSHGMVRTEVRSTLGNAHLGHVFTDAPEETGGVRYCINSAALRFIPLENMIAEGYASYIPLVK